MSEQIADTASIIRRLRDGVPCREADGYACKSQEALSGCDCAIAADKIESDAKLIAALRATILDIGDLADKATHGGGTTFLYGVTLRDIIFRCADVLSSTHEQTAGSK
jgi:hypothetical protein